MNRIVTELLNMLQVSSTAYLSKNLKAPWGVLVEEDPSLARFHLLLSGKTWIGTPGDDHAELLGAGDLAIIPNGKAHIYFDEEGRNITQTGLIPKAYGNPQFKPFDPASSDTHMLCGYFSFAQNAPTAILTHLPDLIIARQQGPDTKRRYELIVNLITEEQQKASATSKLVLNRLTEVLCLYAIEAWLARSMEDNPNLAALAHPNIQLVLDKVHADPSADWSVERLAKLGGQSRTVFSNQFKTATGLSPMNYVRQWRIRLACKMLSQSNLPIDEIAFKSGYADSNAFNRAFKRETGVSPGVYKRKGHA